MSLLSALRTWSNCTGPEVWVTGSVSPSPMFGADGVPGFTSTKKLPSRKIRGRIFIVASLWIGRPVLLISIVTTG